MKKSNKITLFVAVSCLVGFLLWTLLVCVVNVKPIGPNSSSVGLAVINGYVRDFIGCNMLLYTITDWLGLVPIAFALGFGVFGLIQWIKRKRFLAVDSDVLILGVFYIVVFSVYLMFEYVVVNHRPVLINGYLEASYPSSTTMLVLCVMPTAISQFNKRIKNLTLKKVLAYSIAIFMAFMVIGRLISGVHWFSDIFAGLLISASLVAFYEFFSALFSKKK